MNLAVGSRHVRRYVRPALPEVGRKMDLKGTVKLEVEIAANGKVTSVKALGGHPLAVDCAGAAVKNWQVEPPARATSGRSPPSSIEFLSTATTRTSHPHPSP
jgi:TonB family protein